MPSPRLAPLGWFTHHRQLDDSRLNRPRTEMVLTVMRGVLLYSGLLLAITLLTCESSPVDPVQIQTVDRTAIFDGVQVSLTTVNYSWMPRQGLVPEPDVRLVTIEITGLSYASDERSVQPSEFRYRTWDGLRQYELANTTIWGAEPGGRKPPFESLELQNGETFQGWLTFPVPAGLSYLPDEFLWQPDPRVTFSFHPPTSSGSLVCGAANIFGQVTDSDGSPVASAPVELSFYNLSLEENSFEDGECRGEVSFTHESNTDEEGRFEYLPSFRFCDELCVDLTAFPPEGSGLGRVRVNGGTVLPSPLNPIVEPSELRIDAVLPNS